MPYPIILFQEHASLESVDLSHNLFGDLSGPLFEHMMCKYVFVQINICVSMYLYKLIYVCVSMYLYKLTYDV